MTRTVVSVPLGVLLVVVLAGCNSSRTSSGSDQAGKEKESAKMTQGTLPKTDEQWRATLTPEQYRITRQKGTEPAFTGEYWKTKTPGTFRCVCCEQPLFASETKFDSGTGWPSFYAPIDAAGIAFGIVMAREIENDIGPIVFDVQIFGEMLHMRCVQADDADSQRLRFLSESWHGNGN